MRIGLSAHPVPDLKKISDYIENDRSLQVANRLRRLICGRVQSWTMAPNRGRLGGVPGTREVATDPLPCGIVYKVFPDRLPILNIVDGAQRWP